MRPEYLRLLACPRVLGMTVESMHKDNVYIGWICFKHRGQAKSIDLGTGSALGPVRSMTRVPNYLAHQPTMEAILAIQWLVYNAVVTEPFGDVYKINRR